eukprot:6175101-Pyramimonas_sp.AAC.1
MEPHRLRPLFSSASPLVIPPLSSFLLPPSSILYPPSSLLSAPALPPSSALLPPSFPPSSLHSLPLVLQPLLSFPCLRAVARGPEGAPCAPPQEHGP